MPKRPTASTAGTSIAADAGGTTDLAWDMAENITLPLPATPPSSVLVSLSDVLLPELVSLRL